jgi:macrodomain Ter protein organizer (MatP/YcbG family)
VRRTQLYLEQDVWEALHLRSRQLGLTISELVRQAVRERYTGGRVQRRQAMEAFVGLRKDRVDMANSGAYIRKLRRGARLDRLAR